MLSGIVMAGVLAASNLTPAAQYVKSWKPWYSNQQAQDIGTGIERSAKKYKVEVEIVEAILAQESMFTNVTHCFVRHDRQKRLSYTTCDVGIGQINWESWNTRLGLSRCRLEKDIGYNIDTAVRIMAIVRRGHEYELNWWSRYHDAREPLRTKYEALVLNRMPDLEDGETED